MTILKIIAAFIKGVLERVLSRNTNVPPKSTWTKEPKRRKWLW